MGILVWGVLPWKGSTGSQTVSFLCILTNDVNYFLLPSLHLSQLLSHQSNQAKRLPMSSHRPSSGCLLSQAASYWTSPQRVKKKACYGATALRELSSFSHSLHSLHLLPRPEATLPYNCRLCLAHGYMIWNYLALSQTYKSKNTQVFLWI